MADLSNVVSDEMAKIMERNAILGKYKDLEFVNRILNPDLNPTPIDMGNGEFASHQMSAEVDKNGDWFVFPKVVNEEGVLRLIEDPQEALNYNLGKGEVIPFGKDGDAAVDFSANYKPQAFKDYDWRKKNK